jgi:hypothetical protein
MSPGFWSWQSLAWTAGWLVFPLLGERLRGWLLQRGEAQEELYDEIAPWVVGLAPAYLGWILGLVPGRMLGFMGRGGFIGWLLVGLVLAGLLALYWWVFLPRASVTLPDFRADHGLLDEARWAYYRGVGWLWIGNFWWGVLLGFGLTILEWALTQKLWKAERRGDPVTCLHLARRASSTLAFALSANFWLTMIFQAGLIWPHLGAELKETSSE